MNEEVKRPVDSHWDEAEPTASHQNMKQGKTPVVLQVPTQVEHSDPSLLVKIPKKQVEDEVIDMNFIKELPSSQITPDGGVIKYLVSEGKFSDADETLDSNCLARIKLEFRLENGKIITNQHERSNIRRLKLFEKNSHKGLIPAVLSMKPGEISWFTFTSDYHSVNSHGSIEAGSQLYFRIEFLDFSIDQKNLEADDWESRVRAAKERGAVLIQRGDYKKAQAVMNRSAEFIKGFPGKIEANLSPQQKELVASYRIALNNNFALCLIKNGEYKKAIDFLDKVLKHDEKNIKALYRRGLCFRELKDLEAAEKEFNRVLAINPQEEESKKQILEIQKLRNTHNKKEIETFRNIFNSDRWSQETEKEQEQKIIQEKLLRRFKREREAQEREAQQINQGVEYDEDDNFGEGAARLKITPELLQEGFIFTSAGL